MNKLIMAYAIRNDNYGGGFKGGKKFGSAGRVINEKFNTILKVVESREFVL